MHLLKLTTEMRNETGSNNLFCSVDMQLNFGTLNTLSESNPSIYDRNISGTIQLGFPQSHESIYSVLCL